MECLDEIFLLLFIDRFDAAETLGGEKAVRTELRDFKTVECLKQGAADRQQAIVAEHDDRCVRGDLFDG